MAVRPDQQTIKAKLAEIDRRYRRKRHTRPSIATLRLRDLHSLMRARYGEQLPDDAVGRDCARIMVHHLAGLVGDPRKRIGPWLRQWCPWLSIGEADQLLVEALTKPMRWKADKLGWRLRLIAVDRAQLRITTIGAIDQDKASRTKRRREHKRELEQERRRNQGAMPRAEYEAQSISRSKPWVALGMSRRAWYRAGKPQAGTGP